MLFFNLFQIVALEILFSMCGYGLIGPYRRQIALNFPASILVGQLALSFAALLLHVILHIDFRYATFIGISALSLLTIIRIINERPLPARLAVAPSALLIVLALFACLTILRLEVDLGTYAISYYSGTDQFGYAHLADWITTTPANVALDADPSSPWDSWVHYMVLFDPRFGAISYLGIVSTLTGRSGLASYNIGCAVALLSASLGLAGLFSRNAWAFIVTATGIFLSSWFSVAQAGFLGKLLGYPSTLLAAGIMLLLLDDRKTSEGITRVLVSALICICASLSFSALATGSVLLAFGISFILVEYLRRNVDSRGAAYDLTIVLAMFLASVLASGSIARPIYAPVSGMDIPWPRLLMYASQVLAPDRDVGFSPTMISHGLMVAVAVCAALIVTTALISGNAISVAFSAGIVCLGTALFLTNKTWEFYQSASVYLPALYVAASSLSKLTAETHRNSSLSCLAIVLMACGSGRMQLTISKSVGRDATQQYNLPMTSLNEVVDKVKGGSFSSIHKTYIRPTPWCLNCTGPGLRFS